MIKTTQDLVRALPGKDFDLSMSLEEILEEVPFIREFVTYYNFHNNSEDLCFNPQDCKFEIKNTQDLIKANAFRTPSLKFVKKIPLKNLMFRLSIGQFVDRWNKEYEKNVSNNKSEIDLNELLKDKVLLDAYNKELQKINALSVDVDSDAAIKSTEEKIGDISKNIAELKKSVKDREQEASIIRRRKLEESLKDQINYNNIKY